MKRSILVMALAAALLLTSMLPVQAAEQPSTTPEAVGQYYGVWTVQYFNDSYDTTAFNAPSLSAGPLAISWGTNSPLAGVNADNFLSRFTSTPYFSTGGRYRFEAGADDTVTVWVDGQAVTASAPYFDPRTYVGHIDLAVGSHTIVVEHKDFAGDAYVSVNWFLEGASSGGTGTTPTPAPTGSVTGTISTPVGLIFRNMPSTSGTRLGRLDYQTSHTILGRNAEGTWAYLQYNGQNGWSYASWFNFTGDFLSVPIVDSSTLSVITEGTATASVRIRNCPALTCPQVGVVPFGKTAEIFGQSTDGLWLKIKFTPDSSTYPAVTGWSYRSYYTISEGVTLPVVQ
ncbi:MAG: SH3 domain-containing protein [Anaerolineales bacterium]|nr:SH3 domain-containing protein [Anaerolineales bacterium]